MKKANPTARKIQLPYPSDQNGNPPVPLVRRMPTRYFRVSLRGGPVVPSSRWATSQEEARRGWPTGNRPPMERVASGKPTTLCRSSRAGDQRTLCLECHRKTTHQLMARRQKAKKK